VKTPKEHIETVNSIEAHKTDRSRKLVRNIRKVHKNYKYLTLIFSFNDNNFRHKRPLQILGAVTAQQQTEFRHHLHCKSPWFNNS